MLMDVYSVVVYSMIGIVLMLLGNFLIDLMVPCHFPTEIKNGNTAVGWLCAGSFIGIGLIIKAAIGSSYYAAVEESLTNGIISSAIYFVVGIVVFIVGYIVVDIANKKYKLNEEIGSGNTAAGIFVFGIFVGLGLIISGALA